MVELFAGLKLQAASVVDVFVAFEQRLLAALAVDQLAEEVVAVFVGLGWPAELFVELEETVIVVVPLAVTSAAAAVAVHKATLAVSIGLIWDQLSSWWGRT